MSIFFNHQNSSIFFVALGPKWARAGTADLSIISVKESNPCNQIGISPALYFFFANKISLALNLII